MPFHRLYHNSSDQTWLDTYWMGVHIYKNPLDMWIYQEILQDVQPDLIIETGTAAGGSGFFLAQMCELIGHGRVITIDIEGTRSGRASFLRRFPGAPLSP